MKILIIVIVCLIVIGIAFYAYFGGFENIQLTLDNQGGETVVFEKITGDYRQTGDVMDKIYHKLIDDHGIKTYKGYGKYFDNPKTVEKNKLRSEAGCIIETKDLDKLGELANEFNIIEIPVERCITTEFPYKGKISVFFSIMKVYPALNKFAKENGYDENGAVTEIYDIPNKKIRYRKEISG